MAGFTVSLEQAEKIAALFPDDNIKPHAITIEMPDAARTANSGAGKSEFAHELMKCAREALKAN